MACGGSTSFFESGRLDVDCGRRRVACRGLLELSDSKDQSYFIWHFVSPSHHARTPSLCGNSVTHNGMSVDIRARLCMLQSAINVISSFKASTWIIPNEVRKFNLTICINIYVFK